jgi:hypothetical protein
MRFLSSILLFVLVRGTVLAQEVQVPFDSSGTIQVINQDLEKKLDLFPAHPHFLEARLYREPDSGYMLEVSSFENSQLVKDRLPITASIVKLLRNKVDAWLGPQVTALTLNQSSRSKFVLGETLLSTFLYGPAIITAFNSDNAGVDIGLELIIGGSGYFLSSALTRNGPMTDAEGSLALGGAFLGAVHGGLMYELFSKGNPGLGIGPVITAASLAETGIGYAIASDNTMTEGTADMIRYGGLFGMVDGFGLAFAVNNHAPHALWSGLSLAGSVGGFAAGTMMANSQFYNRGSALVVVTIGTYGAYIPAIIYASIINYNFAHSPPSGLPLVGIAGNVGGVILANSFLQTRDFSTSEGTTVILGTTAGCLIGSGLGAILISQNSLSNSLWAFSIPSMVGAVAGFGISLASIGKSTGDKPSTGWNFDANPGALMGALMPRHNNSEPVSVPIFSASCKF